MKAAVRAAVFGLLLLTLGCTSFQRNPKLQVVDENAGYRYSTLARPPLNTEKTFVVLTLSGGGTRAAALAYGALQHLDNTPIAGGKTLLDEVDIISSVSGGSFAAAYYALSDTKTDFFNNFPEAVLYRRIQTALIWRVLAPWNWPRLWSPSFGRSDLLNEYYDKHIFKSLSYGELPQRLPFVILNGTDMSLGAQFAFTQGDFDRLCSDLSGVKVSRAVISSSAFPGAFTPLTWQNYPKEQCGYTAPDWVDLAYGNDADERGDLEFNPFRWDRARVWKSYEDPRRPFIHVIDGGVSDNIGLRGPTAAITSNDSPWSVFNKVNPRQFEDPDKIERVVVIVVDAKPRSRPELDEKAKPPGLISVLAAAASRPVSNYSTDSVELLRGPFREWDKVAGDYEFQGPLCDDLAEGACRESSDSNCQRDSVAMCRELFALTDADRPPHPDLYRIHIRFDAVRDPDLRRELQEIPTTLQLPRDTVNELIQVAGTLLEQSEQFQQLKRDLR